MDFFKNMRDTIRGFSHETRMVIAMGTMGVALLSFFYVWNAVIPLRLISLSPIAPSATKPEITGPVQLTMAGPFEPVPALPADGQVGGSARTDTSESQDVLTPTEGIIGTLAGLGGFFAPARDDQSFTSMASSLRDLGLSAVRGAMRLWEMAVDFVFRIVDALRQITLPFDNLGETITREAMRLWETAVDFVSKITDAIVRIPLPVTLPK